MKKLLLIGLMLTISAVEILAEQFFFFPFSIARAPHSGCTVISLSKGNQVFFGGNDDYILSDSFYWVDTGDSSKYGVVWIGAPDNPQQGINEKGLAYDANGLPRVKLNTHPERIAVPGEYHSFCMKIMHDCATVAEVIAWVKSHQHLPYMHDQMHFADASGDAVIISAGKDGEMVFTRKPPGDGFLVSTNFNVANHSNNFGYPCWRYDKAHEMLGSLLETADPIGFDDITAAMEAVHMEKGSSWTIETMVADLVNGTVYIFFFFQYDRPVVLNIQNELSNPRQPGPFSQLFPEDVQQEAARRYHAARANLRTNWIVGLGWPITLMASLVLLFFNRNLFRKGFRFWITAVIILGPIALIVGYIALKICKKISCRDSLIETLGSLVPIVVSYTLVIAILIISLLSGKASWPLQVGLLFFLPIIIVLMFYMTFLFHLSNLNPGRFLLHLLPLLLVTIFSGLGGIIAVAMPLVNKSLNISLLLPLSPLPLMTWWAIVALGALPGGLLIFLFQRWAIKENFRSWSILVTGDGDIMAPAWGKLWWWILISLGILIAGLLTGVALLN